MASLRLKVAPVTGSLAPPTVPRQAKRPSVISRGVPPRNGYSTPHFITMADIARSDRFYERVFGGPILGLGNVIPEVRCLADAFAAPAQRSQGVDKGQ